MNTRLRLPRRLASSPASAIGNGLVLECRPRLLACNELGGSKATVEDVLGANSQACALLVKIISTRAWRHLEDLLLLLHWWG